MSLASHYASALHTAFGYAEAEGESFVHEPGESAVARGDSFLDDGEEAKVKSVLPGVDDDRWSQFTRCMIVAPHEAVSDSNSLGLFALTPRRLEDLGLVTRLSRGHRAGRSIWVAVFVWPYTAESFLRSPEVQYKTFCDSVRGYAGQIAKGEIEKEPKMSLSGALAILQRCGPQGLKTWASGDRFSRTQAVFDRVQGVF